MRVQNLSKKILKVGEEEKSDNDLSALLSDLLSKHTNAGPDKEASTERNPFGWVSIIEFCESPYYLNLKLYPWQSLIFKIFYMGTDGNRNLKINDSESGLCTDCVWNKNHLRQHSPCLRCIKYSLETKNKIINNFEEEMMLDLDEIQRLRDAEVSDQFKNERHMINTDLISESDSTIGGSVRDQVVSKIGLEFSELLLVLGRRSGKSMIVGILALYESYKMLQMGNPQDVFGNLNEGDTITILNVAVSEQQAKEAVFDKIKPMILNSPYFKTKISPNSLQNRSVRFLTPHDEEINKQLLQEGLPQREGSIYLLSGHSNSDSLVGKSLAVVIIDEMASMVAKDGSKMSDEELYTKLKNSIWTFGKKGKIICISNPLSRDGKFFELYEQSFNDNRILMIQLPSYKVNPTLDQRALDEEREQAQKTGQYESYSMQIEARFSGGSADPFIPSEFIDDAFQKGRDRRRTERGNPNLLYYIHLDPAKNSDNYALAIVHVEENTFEQDVDGNPKKVVIVDHMHMWQPSETGEPVNISEVDNRVLELSRRFNLVSITYDQWESAASSQFLQRMGLPVRITAFNSNYKQSVYSTLRNLFFEGRIEIYAHDGYDHALNVDHYGFAAEAKDQLKFLTKRFNARSMSVNAANAHFDDLPDCIAGASYIALMGEHGYTKLPSSRVMKFR
jgi:hypothetical protein